MTHFKERKGIELQAHILFKLQEARRWTNGCAAQINGMWVGNVVGIQNSLDEVIEGLSKMIERSKDDSHGKTKSG